MAVGQKTFEVEIVTPDQALPAVQTTFAVLPAWDGEVGLLSGRAPLVCKLGAGELRLEVDGQWQRYYVRGGFAEVLNNQVTVLTEKVVPAAELNEGRIRGELDRVKSESQPDRAARDAAIEELEAQLTVVRRFGE